ncbi:hypothetical protein GT370_07780 [Acidocella sp. MX-AZ03]|uniref:hypothetical protein n=1 Tax=Acidocella sp. MX-AZ03 TaxID=2697363 RepID=UPI0022DE9450|nr:hypothetical protein [Acidocella sp. MX-AZ03]WBO60656.1 hypothetical protein GT370_07780 [Acidocella sp. MX-AZ03]
MGHARSPATLEISSLSGTARRSFGVRDSANAAGAGLIPPVAEPFSLQTPIDQIAADPRGKAVLERDLPGMMASPHYQMFNSMSLSDLAPLSGGRLTPEKLKKVQDDLLSLPPRLSPHRHDFPQTTGISTIKFDLRGPDETI